MSILKSKYHIDLYKKLIKKVREPFRSDYERRFKQNPEEQSQVLAEVRSFGLFEKYFSCVVTDIHSNTKNNKNVDFVCENSEKEIHVEVYSNNPKWKRDDNGQYSKIERAIIHGLEKFTDIQPNIVVLADEDINSVLYDGGIEIEEVLRSIWIGNGDNLHSENLCLINALIVLKQSGNFDTDGFSVSLNPNYKHQLPDDFLKRIQPFIIQINNH